MGQDQVNQHSAAEAGAAPSYDVAIAGGGGVGLALALALAGGGAGLKVAVIERDAGLGQARKADGRSYALSAASKRMLDVLGIWDRVADHAQPITEIEITDSALGAAVRPSLLGFDGAVEAGEPAAYLLEIAYLLDALDAEVAACSHIERLAPEQATGLHAGPQAVGVELASGAPLTARLLVAADGKRSALRDKAGIKTVGWTYDQAGIVATIAHERPHGGKAVQHFLPAGPFAMLPLTGNRTSLVWTEKRAEAQRLVALDDAAFIEAVEQRFGREHGRLTLAGPRGAFPLELQMARAFVAERFALAGDAAHAMHPLAGQGLNAGLKDAAALAEVVLEAARLGLDIGSTPVLERYERWRRFDAFAFLAATDALNRLFSNDLEPLRMLRGLGLRLVDKFPFLKDGFVREAAGISGDVPKLLKGEAV